MKHPWMETREQFEAYGETLLKLNAHDEGIMSRHFLLNEQAVEYEADYQRLRQQACPDKSFKDQFDVIKQKPVAAYACRIPDGQDQVKRRKTQ